MRTDRRRSLASRFAVPTALATLLTLTACISHPTVTQQRAEELAPGQIKVVGPRITTRSLARVEALNPRGSIRIVTDDTLRTAEVRATVRKQGLTPQEHARLSEQLDYSAVTTIAGGRMRLAVRPAKTPVDGVIDLEIRVPSVGSVYARNAGGPIEIVGASGELNIQSGSDRLPGGDILVRTDRAIPGPVRIATSEGSVILFLGPAASGDLDLTTAQGKVEVVSLDSPVRDARPLGQRYTGILGTGDNEFFVSTRRGNIRLIVGQGPWESGVHFDWLQNPVYAGR